MTKPNRSRWILLAAMIAGVLILLVFGSRLRVSYRTALTGCARDHGTGGASGIVRWADRIGIPVRLLDRPLGEVSAALPDHAGNCVLTMGNESWSPLGEDLDPVSWQNTRNWISRGNALIAVTTEPGSLPETLRQNLFHSSSERTAIRPGAFFGWDSVDRQPETTVVAVSSGGNLTVESQGPRWPVPSVPAAGASAKGATPTSPAPDLTPYELARDARGGVLYRFPVGQGAVYVLLDEFAWTNSGLDRGDNARVLADVLNREIRGGVLAIDEYRHGHGRTESFLTYALNLPGSTAFLALAAIWAGLYVYRQSVRLKPVEAYGERERRTAQEYIDAVAHLYERARAAPLVVDAVARRLRQLARSSAEPPPSIEALLKSAEDYTREGERPASPQTAIRLVNQLIQLRKRIYGTRTVS